MGSSYINEEAIIFPNNTCIHDSSIGYSADFGVNGEVDGWTYFDGIHTYGCWDGFLFGTIYGDYGIIGRHNIFRPVNATTHYTVRIVMKYNPVPREGNHQLPTKGKVAWRTLSDSSWDDDKSTEFDLSADTFWHTYIVNMGPEQFWQGDVNDLRIWPALEDAQDGDEFFIRVIEITSIESHECLNVNCDKYSLYEHPCPWTGSRGSCESAAGSDDDRFNIDVESEFIININDYGNEVIKIDEVLNGSGYEVGNVLAQNISSVDIGGYAEVQVVYTDDNTFKIYSGTRNTTSTVEVLDSALARSLGFFDHLGNDTSTRTTGELPATGYSPLSSFRIKTYSLLSLFDNNESSQVYFDPFRYSIEGGRRDWLESGLGIVGDGAANNPGEEGGQTVRSYSMVFNDGRTIIDFNHPFNASGRITHISLACTLDMSSGKYRYEGEAGENDSRRGTELSGAKVMIFRPKRDGTLDPIHEFEIPSRDPDRTVGDTLYALSQETVSLDVDVHVNKGDLLGVYNANVYYGKSITGTQIDAQYYQVPGKPTSNFNPGELNGDGSSGVLFYSRGEEHQRRLVIDMDLRHRYNLENVEVYGEPQSTILEYNIARCLDINWEVELFGEDHWTKHTKLTQPGTFSYQRYNVAYGIDRLSDGIYDVPDGKACDSFYLTGNNSGAHTNYNAGPGVVPTNPYYFWVNGDQEWLAVYLHALWFQGNQEVVDFKYDPIAIYMTFPFQKNKTIYKSKIYFKEKQNFRNLALSTYGGDFYSGGDADDSHYDLLPGYTAITLDNARYDYGSALYQQVDKYLFLNPAIGREDIDPVGDPVYEWDENYSQLIQDFGQPGDTGLYVYQSLDITNEEEMQQARATDWQVIIHEWEPVSCKGWRIYTDYHKSTKICEMELYGVSEDLGSAFAGGINLYYSDYEEIWWPTESTEVASDQAEIFIGDTPQYLQLDLLPVTAVYYNDVKVNIQTEDSYVGARGCEYSYYLDHAKLGASNEANRIDLKNVYGVPYDLYVDIAPDNRIDDGIIYYSTLESEEAITNPALGPDSSFYKLFDYALRNDNWNCAINCDVYGIKNLIDGKDAYYSRNDGLTWFYHSTLTNGESIDFSNLPGVSRSVLRLPILSRNRYWKIEPENTDVSTIEIETWFEGTKLAPRYYHDIALPALDGPIADEAHHIDNDSITGSYYTLNSDDRLGIDLGAQESIDTIVFYHDDFDCALDLIDEYIQLYLPGENFLDQSYYEQPITLVGYASVDTTASGINLGKGSIYFGDTNSYLTCPHTEGFNLRTKWRSFDLFVKFEERPADGEEAIFLQNWGPGGNHFKFDLYNDAGIYKLRYNNTSYKDWTPTINVWYHLSWGWGDRSYAPGQRTFFIDGVQYLQQSGGTVDYGTAVNDIVVGLGLKGWISHLRWSSGTDGCASKATKVWAGPEWDPPTETAAKKYNFKIYSSIDNIHYGLYADVDMFHENRDAYFIEGSEVETEYREYFAVDLGRRHNLDIIRNYGTTDAYDFMTDGEIGYSADDVSDISSATFDSTLVDARWIKIGLISSDATDRVIRKLGVYPEITENIAPPGDAYNCEWDSLGPSITAYSAAENLALGASISGSSSITGSDPEQTVDGIISNDFAVAWKTDDSTEQWLTVDLGEEKEVWRVKLHHGYDDADTDYMNVDYQIQMATTSGAFNTVHTITGNSELERIHDLAIPVTARYVRLYISAYNSRWTNVRNPETAEYERFEGVCLREIEIYEYYGYETINSEDYPIIAINMKDQFFVASHEIVGLYAEDSDYDWDNSNSSFAYSDSVFSDPQKIAFTSFGTLPDYEQWVVVKRNTASYYNDDPPAAGNDTGVDYIKHLIVQASGIGVKPNPADYPWWWTSDISTLSRDYDSPVELCVTSLRIDYPASTALDNIQFIEGDDWGIDSDIGHRDGLSFRLYIEDVDKLDLSEGYIYFGGLDGTEQQNPVEYRWYLSTFSGTDAFQTGWNRPFFRFKTADEIVYTEVNDDTEQYDPTSPERITLKTLGMKFRGVGQPLTLNIDGFTIKRNYFEDQTAFHAGLYLTGGDYLSCPLGEIDFSAGAIEFLLRPDYGFDGLDIYNRFANRSLFHFGNVANDVFGAAVLSNGIGIYYGELAAEPGLMLVQGLDVGAYDQIWHVAVVFSNTGDNIDADNSTIRLYINNYLVGIHYEPWIITDTKAFRFSLGGKVPFAIVGAGNVSTTHSVDGVISDLRMYNYCKTDFSGSMEGNYQTTRVNLTQPSKMIEISDDNVTFYRVEDPELPLFFEKVDPDITVPIYVRSIVSEPLTGKEKRTSGIVAGWNIGV